MAISASTPLPGDSTSRRDQKFRSAAFRGQPVTGDVQLWLDLVPIKPGWISLSAIEISRTVYFDLFTVANNAGLVGTVFGIGDGVTTFEVPNINGSAPTGFIYIMKV